MKECEFVGRWLLKVRGKERRYCRNHFFLYVEHERIVERIRAIPDRTAI